MTQPTSRCLFTEGCIELPAGFFDHTVNVLRSPDPAAPAYSVARDRLPQGVTLQDYINGQLAIMEKHLPGWQKPERSSVSLGKGLMEGERIVTSYQRDGQRICQQQAIFELKHSQILVFTQTKNSEITEADKAQFSALVASFNFHAA
jgi:hypothetical protein